MSSESKPKNIFHQGAIDPQFISESIRSHQSKTSIGAHSIFLGQVRADEIEGKSVEAIEYTAYTEMALEQMAIIREEAFANYDLNCLHIYQSLGVIKAGEVCLFVFTSSKHRKQAIDACEELVERIKKELPIWGREVFNDHTHQWKENT